MSYCNIDRNRYKYLLLNGTNPSEISQFFKDRQRSLILHGAKVQNRPSDYEAAIRMLTSGMPTSTDEVVQEWFSKHISYEKIEDPEIIIAVYKRFEESIDIYLSKDDAFRFARSCLIHIFSAAPSTSLIEFLKTPVIKSCSPPSETICNPDIQAASKVDIKNFAEILIDIIEGKGTIDHLEHFPPETAEFITGLLAGSKGQFEVTKSVIEALPNDSVFLNPLDAYLKRANERLNSDSKVENDKFEESFDFQSDEVLGYCTRSDKPTTVFVRAIAVVRNNQLFFLTDEKRHELFPENGDLIAFQGHGYPQQPRRGEFGIWKVSEHDTDKATHFHLASEKRPVYEIQLIPFNTTDYDNVRDAIKNIASQTANGAQPLLFRLSDGFYVGSKSNKKQDLSKDEMFEDGLSLWNTLEILHYEGRILVPGPLPKEHHKYDCASMATTIRKLFKNRTEVESTAELLSKSQLSTLIRSLSSSDTELDGLRIQRVKAQLEMLMKNEEAFHTLLKELTNHQLIKQRIDEYVEQKTEELLSEKNVLQADIHRLQKEQKDWHERIRKQNEEYRKLPDSLSKAVKNAFEKAQSEGLSMIAELAVFKALYEPFSSASTNNPSQISKLTPSYEPVIRDLAPDCLEVVSFLKSLGVSSRKAKAFSLIGEIALKAGLLFCIRGTAARIVVEGWANNLSQQGILIDSTVGLIDDKCIRNTLTGLTKPGVLAILDANLSALDIYARPVVDLVLKRLVTPSHEQHPAIIFSLTNGVAALPLPETFSRISIQIDLDANYDFGITDLEDLKPMATNKDDGYLYMNLWKPAADRYIKVIEELNEEEQALILAVLKTTFGDFHNS